MLCCFLGRGWVVPAVAWRSLVLPIAAWWCHVRLGIAWLLGVAAPALESRSPLGVPVQLLGAMSTASDCPRGPGTSPGVRSPGVAPLSLGSRFLECQAPPRRAQVVQLVVRRSGHAAGVPRSGSWLCAGYAARRRARHLAAMASLGSAFPNCRIWRFSVGVRRCFPFAGSWCPFRDFCRFPSRLAAQQTLPLLRSPASVSCFWRACGAFVCFFSLRPLLFCKLGCVGGIHASQFGQRLWNRVSCCRRPTVWRWRWKPVTDMTFLVPTILH